MKISKIILCFLLVLTLKTNHAQTCLLHYHSIDIVIGAEAGVVHLAAKDSDERPFDILNSRDNAETIKSNLRAGLNYNYALNERLVLKTGVHYFNPGYKAKKLNGLNEEEQSQLKSVGLLDNAEGIQYTYHFLEIPSVLRYITTRQGCMSYIEAGISSNIYLQSRITQDSNKAIHFKDNINKVNLAANLAVGGEFYLFEETLAFIQLATRYQLQPITNDDIDERIVSLGIQSGVRLAF